MRLSGRLVWLVASMVGLGGWSGTAASAPAPKARYVSAYTSIAGPRCGDKPRRATLDEDEPVRYRCRVLRAFDVDTVYTGTSVSLTLSGRGGSPVRLGAGYAVGDRIEWRGKRGPGRFVPEAAILHLQNRDSDGEVGTTVAILRIEGGKLCKAAFLDGNGPDLADHARAVADSLAATFRCGVSRPTVIGPTNDALKNAVSRANSPS